MARLILFCIVNLIVFSTYSQKDKWEYIMFNDNINCLEQENDSILWVGTWAGELVRYNFVDFTLKTYNGLNSVINDTYFNVIRKDINGSLWIGTKNGLIKIDNAGKWILYNISNSELPNNNIIDIYANSTGVYILCFEGGILSISNDGKWRIIDSGKETYSTSYNRCIWVEDSGIIWVGYGRALLDYGGLVKIEKSKWTNYCLENANFPVRYIYDICEDDSNNFWYATYTEGILKKEGDNYIEYNSSNTCFKNDAFVQVQFDTLSRQLYAGNGYRNFSGEEYGIYILKDSEWQFAYDTNLKEFGSVQAILPLNNGQLYIGTEKGLKLKVEDEFIPIKLTRSFLPSSNIICMKSDLQRNRLWIGTDSGLCLVDQDTSIAFNLKNSILPKGHVNFISIDNQGNTFVNIRYEYFKYQNELWTKLTDFYNVSEAVFNLENTMFYADLHSSNHIIERTDTSLRNIEIPGIDNHDLMSPITIDDNNQIYCSFLSNSEDNQMGMYKYDFETWTMYSTENSAIKDKPYSMIFDNEGKLWITSFYGSLQCLNENTFQTFNFESLNYNVYELSIDYIDSQNNLWMSSNSGLKIFDHDTIWTLTTNNSEVLSNDINDICIDSHGKIWMATTEGLCVFEGNKEEIIQTISSVKKSSNTINIEVYPNPVTDDLKINLEGLSLINIDAVVTDILGRQLINQRIDNNNSNLNMINLRSGVYVLSLYSESRLLKSVTILKNKN